MRRRVLFLFSCVPITAVLVRSFLEALSSLNSKNPETLDWRPFMCTCKTSRLRRYAIGKGVGMEISVITQLEPGTVLLSRIRHAGLFVLGKVVP